MKSALLDCNVCVCFIIYFDSVVEAAGQYMSAATIHRLVKIVGSLDGMKLLIFV